MELYVYTKERKLAGIVEAFEYLRWMRRYDQCGSFELKAIANENNLALLQMGNILWKSDDDEAGIIEFVEMITREQEYITVSGRFATSFLARRIIWGTETLRGDVSVAVSQLINKHLISPIEPARRIAGITFSAPALGKPVNTQVSYRNLLSAVTGLCEASDVGIRTSFSPITGTFDITLYNGSDTLAVFSKAYENIMEQVFTQSLKDYASIALVGGEGEGAERTFVTTGTGSGEERYELFVDAKDLRSEDFPDAYADALIFRGNSKLHALAMVQAFDVTVNPYGNLIYKQDYDIGSRVQAVSPKWGVTMTARITEIDETYDREGMGLAVTFGKPLLTLAEKLQAGGI